MAQKTVLSLFFALSIALFTSCSDEFKPIDRITAEELAAMQSSSSEESSSSVEPSSSSSAPLCGELEYNQNQSCIGGEIHEKCGSLWFELQTHFCHNGSKIGQKCGTREEIYDPDLYECKPDINPNGIYLKSKPKDEDDNEYEAVLIGSQTWMAENLNYANKSSDFQFGVCYDGNPDNCAKYGRLYSWGVASTLCPDGWHLPSDEEWIILMNYVGGSPGKKLKATSGWNDYQEASGNGTDEYGFLALPGGRYYYNAYFNLGEYSFWWTSSETNNDHEQAQYYSMRYDSGITDKGDNHKNSQISVRCLQD